MFTINGIEYRSLIEQVKQNGQDILNIKNGGLTSTAGLVIEQSVQTVEDLPVGKFGVGVLVGTSADNQHLYAFLSTASVIAGEWVDLGQYPAPGIQGIQGEQGVQGIQGEQGVQGVRGSMIFTEKNPPTEQLQNGDIAIKTNGDLYVYVNNNWQYLTNIQGLQGIQGEQGVAGDTPYINNGTWWIGGTDTGIVAKGQSGIAVILQSGIYTNDTVPNFASTQNLDGFIVKTANGYDLYIHAMNGTEYTIVENWAGVPGEQGIQGVPGVGVQSINATKSTEDDVVVNYTLTTTLTNGTQQNSGTLSIPKGLQGQQGEAGQPGKDSFITSEEQLKAFIDSYMLEKYLPVGTYIGNEDASFNPNTKYGGTWEKLGEGQIPIQSNNLKSVLGATLPNVRAGGILTPKNITPNGAFVPSHFDDYGGMSRNTGRYSVAFSARESSTIYADGATVRMPGRGTNWWVRIA